MVVKRRVGLLLATAAVFAAGSASAQTAQQADLDKVEQMQRRMQQLQDQMKQQTQQLQDQMKQVTKELADAKKKAAEVKAADPNPRFHRLSTAPTAPISSRFRRRPRASSTR